MKYVLLFISLTSFAATEAEINTLWRSIDHKTSVVHNLGKYGNPRDLLREAIKTGDITEILEVQVEAGKFQDKINTQNTNKGNLDTLLHKILDDSASQVDKDIVFKAIIKRLFNIQE